MVPGKSPMLPVSNVGYVFVTVTLIGYLVEASGQSFARAMVTKKVPRSAKVSGFILSTGFGPVMMVCVRNAGVGVVPSCRVGSTETKGVPVPAKEVI